MTRLARTHLLAAAMLLGCGDDLGPRVPAAIIVTPDTPQVALADTLRLTATVVDAVGRKIDGHAVTFRSSDETVLTVDDAGLLTSVGSTGTARITASSGEITAEVEAEVAVLLPPSSVLVTPGSFDLEPGQQDALSVTVTDENGQPVPDPQVTVQASDPAVVNAEVTSTLPRFIYVTGLALGTATLTVSSGGASTDVPVTVRRLPANATITPSTLVLSSGGSEQLTAALLDRLGNEMDLPHPFTWTSSNEAVVTVSSTGVVTSVGPEGTAIISATVDTFTAELGVFVGTAPAGQWLARLGLEQPVAGAATTADGRYFVSANGKFVGGQLPDIAFSFQVPTEGYAREVILNAAGTRAYLVGISPGVIVVDLAAQAVVDSIPVHLGSAYTGAFSSDGSVLIVGTDQGFEMIDLASKASLGGTAAGRIEKMTHHPSRPLLYASGAAGVLELDDRSGAIVRRFAGRSEGAHVVSPDGTRLYAVSLAGGGVRVWNLDTGAQERTLPDVFGSDVAISPDGRFLYVTLGTPEAIDRLSIVDAASGIPVRQVALGGLTRRVALSLDGTAIITNENSVGGLPGWVDFVR